MKQLILILMLMCIAGLVGTVYGQTKTTDSTSNNGNPLNHHGPGSRPPATVVEKVVDDHSNKLQHQGGPGSRVIPVQPGRKLDTLSLPFRDDFSYKQEYPDTSLWVDNYAYINSTYPTNPLSYGVATLSGLNQYGVAFAVGGDSLLDATYYGANSLTSMPIDLSHNVGDTSLYFSFAYEPQGLGDYPSITTGDEGGDSLILEFSENDTTWDEIWAIDGYPGPIADPTFSSVIIQVSSLPNAPAYQRRGMQFRFRNYADILGNNNHWHIDYVYLASGRTSGDTTYRNNLTMLASPGGFLKNYTSMPWTHFYNYQNREVGDSAHFCAANSFNAPISPHITMDVTELYSNTVIPSDTFSGGFTLNSLDSQCFARKIIDSAISFTPLDTDSVDMRVRVYVDHQPTDYYPDNDTVYTDVDFYNYFAYDDGSAEKAYGLEGEETDLLSFAYQFHLNHPDTLRAIQIHFSTIDYNTDLDLFSLMVWKSINYNNDTATHDSIVFEEDYLTPVFVDSFNGWTTFTIKDADITDSAAKDSGYIVLSDTFYIGWMQINGSNLEVGYDCNDNALQYMYYSADGVWQSSYQDTTIIPGAPMLRPVVGKNVPIYTTGVNKVVPPNNFSVYPNPVHDNLYSSYKPNQHGTYAEIYDLTGRLVSWQPYNNNEAINVSNLTPGMYLLRFNTPGQYVNQVTRFVKM